MLLKSRAADELDRKRPKALAESDGKARPTGLVHVHMCVWSTYVHMYNIRLRSAIGIPPEWGHIAGLWLGLLGQVLWVALSCSGSLSRSP